MGVDEREKKMKRDKKKSLEVGKDEEEHDAQGGLLGTRLSFQARVLKQKKEEKS